MLEGDLVISNLSEIKNHLLKMIDRQGPVKITLKNVDRLDVSFVQLLIAFKKAADNGRPLRIDLEDSEYINNWFALAGLDKKIFN